MKVAPVLVAALLLCTAIPGSNQGKPNFCKGADGNRYKKGESYEDEEACFRYTCIKSRNKLKMKKDKIIPCPKPGLTLHATCDNNMKIFADTKWLITDNDWTKTSEVKIPENTNSIEIHCYDLHVVGGILASFNSGIKTDGTWSCSADGGATWNSAYEIGSNGLSPWGVRPQISTEAKWIWTGNDTYHGKHKNVTCKISLDIEQNLAANVTALESKFQTLQDSVQSLQTSMDSVQEMMATIKSTCSQLESCFADISSSDCPSPANGKTSVAGGISANTAALDDKCDASTCSDIQEAIAELQQNVKMVLVLGPDPWITVDLEDFSLISSNLSVPAPGVDYTFPRQGLYSVGKVINGKMYVCDTENKFCISYNGTGLEWKLENEMKPVTSRAWSAQTLTPGDQPKWIVQGDVIPCANCFKKDIDVWTLQSGKWKTEIYSPPYQNDIGCIAVIDGKILQVGGRIYEGGRYPVYTNRVFLGDVEVASMNATRLYHHCTMFENQVWVAGGGVGNGKPPHTHTHARLTVEIYDYKTDTWTFGPSLPFDRMDTGKLKVIQGDLYFICTDCGQIFKLINNHEEIYTWKAMADIPKNSGFIVEVMEINH